jgi:hypothetical protein
MFEDRDEEHLRRVEEAGYRVLTFGFRLSEDFHQLVLKRTLDQMTDRQRNKFEAAYAKEYAMIRQAHLDEPEHLLNLWLQDKD